jgi:hypothetical protein
LQIGGLFDFFLMKNEFKFIESPQMDGYDLDSDIRNLTVETYNYKLDFSVLSDKVFHRVVNLYLGKSISSIQSDLFKSWANLKNILFDMDILGYLFYQAGIEWMKSLNWNLKNVNLALISVKEFTKLAEASQINVVFREGYGYNAPETSFKHYSYPDEDFCIFAEFPHEKLIFPFLDSKLKQCSSTILWLTKYYYLYADNKQANLTNEYYESLKELCILNNNNNNNRTDAWFENKIKNCKLSQPVTVRKPERTSYDFISGFDLTSSFVTLFLIPLACFSGFMLNFKIIRLIKKNRKSELKENFYRYMSMNSRFNCIYSLVYIFSPMNMCIYYVYCSAVVNTFAAQYFKIIVIVYIGQCIKACANMSYIFITINRYMLIGKDHWWLFEELTKISVNRTILSTVIFSLIFNMPSFLEYEINDGTIFFTNAQYVIFPYAYPLLVNYSDYFSISPSSRSYTLSSTTFCS